MSDLNALMVFAIVVEETSFSQAARRLKMPISTVSRKVADLEDQLGVRLLERSTRQLRLTDIGAEIYEQAQKSVELKETVVSLVSHQQRDVKGVLRLSAPPSVSESIIVPLTKIFQDRYPDVYINTLITDRFVDHIAEGVDLAFRVGPLQDSALVAQKILRYRPQLVASPAYLQSVEAPLVPQDLLQHRLFAFSFWNRPHSWTFFKDQASETLSFHPHMAMNDYAGLGQALVMGAGIGDLPPIVCPSLLREGKLVEVMPTWRFASVDLFVVHLGNRHIPRHVRLFKELAFEMVPNFFDDLPSL